MIFGVVSDIHSNLEALQSVLAEFERRKVDGYICCGDFTGYGPYPDEVVKLMSKLPNLSAVSGNHDLAVIGKMDVEWFNENARAAVLWTQKQLSAESRKFLESLPPRVDQPSFMVVHGSPKNPPEEYLITRQQFLDNAPHIKNSPCFVGHSHITCSFGGDPAQPGSIQSRLLADGVKISIPEDLPWVLNPGSVGQPRDRDVRASCGIYNDENREFTIYRIAYDIPAVQLKMRSAGLPEFLAQRLTFGQ